MITKTITVTQEHFDKGLRDYNDSTIPHLLTRTCAMAQALRDAFPDVAASQVTSGIGVGYVGKDQWRYDDTGYQITCMFDEATNPLVSRGPAGAGGFGRKASNQGFGRI